jgi:hypothetical protein
MNDDGVESKVGVTSDLLAPRARQRGLVVRELDDETVVYDLDRDEAHCLNPAVALVWKHCDGQTTVAEMAAIVRERVEGTVGDDTVWNALVLLGQCDLLEEQVSRPADGTISRRGAMRKAAIVGVAIPLIATLPVFTPHAIAQTCIPNATGCIPNGNGQNVCTHNAQCCSCCCHFVTGDANAHCNNAQLGNCIP